jgi:hypothetical protein
MAIQPLRTGKLSIEDGGWGEGKGKGKGKGKEEGERDSARQAMTATDLPVAGPEDQALNRLRR